MENQLDQPEEKSRTTVIDSKEIDFRLVVLENNIKYELENEIFSFFWSNQTLKKIIQL